MVRSEPPISAPGGRAQVFALGRATWQAFERDWIGVRRPSPVRVLEEAGWMPDRPGVDYCPRCGESVGPGEWVPGSGCGTCRHRRPPWPRFVRLGAYEEPLRNWITEFKFAGWAAMGTCLGDRLGGAVASLVPAGVEAVVPVPTTLGRRWTRGLDQTWILARGVGRRVDGPSADLLVRSARPPQRSVPASARRANVRGAFRLSRAGRRHARRERGPALVVDDIATSRSTLAETCRTLRRGGIAVAGVAVLAVAGSRLNRVFKWP